MASGIPVNGAKVRDAMNRQHLSDRQVNTLCRIGQQAARTAVLQGQLHSSLPLSKVRDYLALLGLTWGELFDDPYPDTPTDSLPATERQQTLARILTTSDRHIPEDHLCAVFGIPLHELRADIDALRPLFAALGFTIIVSDNASVLLARGTDTNDDEAQARHAQLRDAQRDLNLSAALTLYRAYKGTLSTRELSNNDQVQVTSLTKRGALGPPSSNHRTPLSDDTLYCLTPPEDD